MAGVGCYFLLQRVDPGIERLSPALAGEFFYLWAIWEALVFFTTKKRKGKKWKDDLGVPNGGND